MTREDIIRMAREVKYLPKWMDLCRKDEDALVRFFHAAYAAGAAAEREACAKVCESRYMGDNNREDMEARRCAAAIRGKA